MLKIASTAWLMKILTLLLITLSLRQNCLTSVSYNLSKWTKEKKSANQGHLNRGLDMIAGVNVVGFVIRWNQRKKLCVAETTLKFQKKEFQC